MELLSWLLVLWIGLAAFVLLLVEKLAELFPNRRSTRLDDEESNLLPKRSDSTRIEKKISSNTLSSECRQNAIEHVATASSVSPDVVNKAHESTEVYRLKAFHEVFELKLYCL